MKPHNSGVEQSSWHRALSSTRTEQRRKGAQVTGEGRLAHGKHLKGFPRGGKPCLEAWVIEESEGLWLVGKNNILGKEMDRLRCVCVGYKEKEEMQQNRKGLGVGKLVSSKAAIYLKQNSAVFLS